MRSTTSSIPGWRPWRTETERSGVCLERYRRLSDGGGALRPQLERNLWATARPSPTRTTSMMSFFMLPG
jgi:hypothetical protein